MKNNDNTALLAHKRRIDAQRKATAIARREAERKAQNAAAFNKIAAAKRVGQ